jgi:hypothetical protein
VCATDRRKLCMHGSLPKPAVVASEVVSGPKYVIRPVCLEVEVFHYDTLPRNVSILCVNKFILQSLEMYYLLASGARLTQVSLHAEMNTYLSYHPMITKSGTSPQCCRALSTTPDLLEEFPGTPTRPLLVRPNASGNIFGGSGPRSWWPWESLTLPEHSHQHRSLQLCILQFAFEV